MYNLELISVCCHLPSIDPKQLCALAHLRCTPEASTYYYEIIFVFNFCSLINDYCSQCLYQVYLNKLLCSLSQTRLKLSVLKIFTFLLSLSIVGAFGESCTYLRHLWTSKLAISIGFANCQILLLYNHVWDNFRCGKFSQFTFLVRSVNIA